MLQALQSLVSDLLGQDISMDEPLMEAGLDSIGAVELRNSVASKYGIDLPATISFDQPTVRALAGYLAAMLAPQRRTQLQTDVGSFELVSLHPSKARVSGHIVVNDCAYPMGLLWTMHRIRRDS